VPIPTVVGEEVAFVPTEATLVPPPMVTPVDVPPDERLAVVPPPEVVPVLTLIPPAFRSIAEAGRSDAANRAATQVAVARVFETVIDFLSWLHSNGSQALDRANAPIAGRGESTPSGLSTPEENT
jgi:hypothetical protein